MALPQTVERLLALSPEQRADVWGRLSLDERAAITRLIEQEIQHPYRRYANDPRGFVNNVLHESLWELQREIMEAVLVHKRVAVPSCHGPGKSWLAARIVAWFVCSHPIGTVKAITTAPTGRQVRAILWPHIRRLVDRHGLPGYTNQVEWWVEEGGAHTRDEGGHTGVGEMVAFGFSPGSTDEAPAQGIHEPNLIIVLDEAGGIGNLLAASLAGSMTGGNTRMLAIGNPSTDDEDTWFERICESDLWHVIRIPASATPNFTGEKTGLCGSCPTTVPPHEIATHLVDQDWVDDTIADFGENSAYVVARVEAEFPHMVPNRVMPIKWLEAAQENDHHGDGNTIRLGVDVAADGGDEFVIASADGFVAKIRHAGAGDANAKPQDVAAMCLDHVRWACEQHAERGNEKPVRVKIDAIGLGWGVAGMLEQQIEAQGLNAEVIYVNVSERAGNEERFTNQRAEMWWNGRISITPRTIEGVDDPVGLVKLDVERKVISQLSAPTYTSDGSGRIKIESKKSIKSRGLSSPDRAEAVLLALYEPPRKEPSMVATPLSIEQVNQWGVFDVRH